MNLNQAANCLQELGHPTRLAIVRLLVRAGDEGLSVGAVQSHLGIPASTLSHHITHLLGADLICQKRAGRVLWCTPNFDLLRVLVDVLTEECCSGVPELDEREAS